MAYQKPGSSKFNVTVAFVFRRLHNVWQATQPVIVLSRHLNTMQLQPTTRTQRRSFCSIAGCGLWHVTARRVIFLSQPSSRRYELSIKPKHSIIDQDGIFASTRGLAKDKNQSSMTALHICHVIQTVQIDIASLPGTFDQIAIGFSVGFNHMLHEMYCDVNESVRLEMSFHF